MRIYLNYIWYRIHALPYIIVRRKYVETGSDLK